MSASKFAALIDSVAKCTKCGKPASARCRCHEPKDPVRLVCGICKKELVVEREPDFFDYDVIETTCPGCTREERCERAGGGEKTRKGTRESGRTGRT